jgi:hypothetical protein
MWARAKVLLDRAPFYAVTQPLVGVALGVAVGGLYGVLCGACWGLVWGSLAVVLNSTLHDALAGAGAGLIMGVCVTLDRAARRPAVPPEPNRHRDEGASTNGHAMPHRFPSRGRLRQRALLAILPLAGLLVIDRGTPLV